MQTATQTYSSQSTLCLDSKFIWGVTLGDESLARQRPSATLHNIRPAEIKDLPDRSVHIRLADSDGQRSDAGILINRMYAKRGYQSTGLPEHSTPSRITLVANERDTTIGTMTIGFDTAKGLLVDELFAEETAALRKAGHRVCEFTKLALDGVMSSRRVLASLFHIAYIYSHCIVGATSLLIEVNPRHVSYYKRVLGFKVIGTERMNPRVNAPAVLMGLDFAQALEQFERLGGQAGGQWGERSLYPYFLSAGDVEGIVCRLRNARARPSLESAFDHSPLQFLESRH